MHGNRYLARQGLTQGKLQSCRRYVPQRGHEILATRPALLPARVRDDPRVSCSAVPPPSMTDYTAWDPAGQTPFGRPAPVGPMGPTDGNKNGRSRGAAWPSIQ